MEWVHSINSKGKNIMTVKELIEKLKTVDPDMEVVIEAPDSGYYTDEYYEYGTAESLNLARIPGLLLNSDLHHIRLKKDRKIVNSILLNGTLIRMPVKN